MTIIRISKRLNRKETPKLKKVTKLEIVECDWCHIKITDDYWTFNEFKGNVDLCSNACIVEWSIDHFKGKVVEFKE